MKPPQVGQPTVHGAPRFHCLRASRRHMKAPLLAEGGRQPRAALFPAIRLPPNCLLPAAFCLPLTHTSAPPSDPPSSPAARGYNRPAARPPSTQCDPQLRSSILYLLSSLFTSIWRSSSPTSHLPRSITPASLAALPTSLNGSASTSARSARRPMATVPNSAVAPRNSAALAVAALSAS